MLPQSAPLCAHENARECPLWQSRAFLVHIPVRVHLLWGGVLGLCPKNSRGFLERHYLSGTIPAHKVPCTTAVWTGTFPEKEKWMWFISGSIASRTQNTIGRWPNIAFHNDLPPIMVEYQGS